jgi:hypothetical protein
LKEQESKYINRKKKNQEHGKEINNQKNSDLMSKEIFLSVLEKVSKPNKKEKDD